MVVTRQSAQMASNGATNGHANGHANDRSSRPINGYKLDSSDEKIDRSRWRLLDESGRHTWHYLKSDKEVEEWPQTTADKYHLGQPTVRIGTSLRSIR